jgi:hypothetical protein
VGELLCSRIGRGLPKLTLERAIKGRLRFVSHVRGDFSPHMVRIPVRKDDHISAIN